MTTHEVMSDQDLVESYRLRADSGALGELFNRYHRLILFVCMKYMRNGQEAEDAAYEAFCRLQTSAQEIGITNVKGWLYQAARNECLMRLRSKVYEFESLDTVQEHDIAQRPDAENMEEERIIGHLNGALSELDDPQRRCIQLFFYEHKTHREIADLLHCSLDQVRSHLQNGKRMMRLILERKALYERSA